MFEKRQDDICCWARRPRAKAATKFEPHGTLSPQPSMPTSVSMRTIVSSNTDITRLCATAGVKLSENGQFEKAAMAGPGRAAPGPSDCEEDNFSIGCGRRYLE